MYGPLDQLAAAVDAIGDLARRESEHLAGAVALGQALYGVARRGVGLRACVPFAAPGVLLLRPGIGRLIAIHDHICDRIGELTSVGELVEVRVHLILRRDVRQTPERRSEQHEEHPPQGSPPLLCRWASRMRGVLRRYDRRRLHQNRPVRAHPVV